MLKGARNIFKNKVLMLSFKTNYSKKMKKKLWNSPRLFLYLEQSFVKVGH